MNLKENIVLLKGCQVNISDLLYRTKITQAAAAQDPLLLTQHRLASTVTQRITSSVKKVSLSL